MYLKTLKITAGITLLGLGLIGLVLPIIPGILLLLAGLFLLEIKTDMIKAWFRKIRFVR